MTDSPTWPLRWPYSRFGAIVISFACLIRFLVLWRNHAPLLQAYYLPSYVRTIMPPIPFWNQYTVVMKGSEMALQSDQGDLTTRNVRLNPDVLRAWLRENIYDDKPLYSVLHWPLIGFGCVFVLLIYLGGKLDRGINSEARDGRLIRGPKMISHLRWNLRTFGKPSHFYIETK